MHSMTYTTIIYCSHVGNAPTTPTHTHANTQMETHQPTFRLLIPAERGRPAGGSRAGRPPGWGARAPEPHRQRSDPHPEGCHAVPAPGTQVKGRFWDELKHIGNPFKTLFIYKYYTRLSSLHPVNTHTLHSQQPVKCEEFPWRQDGCTCQSLIFTSHKCSLIISLRHKSLCIPSVCTPVCVGWCVFVWGRIKYAVVIAQPEPQQRELETLNINRIHVIHIPRETEEGGEEQRRRRKQRRWK